MQQNNDKMLVPYTQPAETERRTGGMWATYIMNLLLLLQAFGTSPSPGSQAAAFDFNGNGVIDSADLMELLAQQPPLCTQPKSWPTPSR